jgi:hypothetical protein
VPLVSLTVTQMHDNIFTESATIIQKLKANQIRIEEALKVRITDYTIVFVYVIIRVCNM